MSKSNNPVSINRTKLYQPSVGADYVSRGELETRLEENSGLALTLVCAPAGYGKSALISHWLNSSESRSAWLSLDESDAETRVFLTYFVTALRSIVTEACKETFATIHAESLPPLSLIATQLCNDLDELDKRLILVLDDYHRIANPDIDFLIGSLLERPSRNLHLVILSRRDPALALASLRAYSLLNEIRMRDLKFSSEDTLAYIAQTVDFPLQAINIQGLQNHTEGWPVGVRLAALALKHQDNVEEYLNNFGRNSRPLQEFLISEVLSVQSAAVQDCLLNISILDRFNAELCDAVCSEKASGEYLPENGEEFIELLQNSSLFCISLDDSDQWFRFHHLFGDLLQKQLEERCGSEKIFGLHKKASRWFASNGYVEEAIHHALAGKDVAAAAEIVGAARHQLMNGDNWLRLDRWLDLFTHEVIQQQVQLILLRCWLDMYHWYRIDYLVKDLEQAEVLLQSETLEPSKVAVLKAEVAAIRSNLAYWILEPESGAILANQALRDSPDEHECVRSTALFGLGGINQMLGDSPQSEKIIWEHMEDGRFKSPSSRARLLLPLCLTYWPDADTNKLLKTASGMMQLGIEHELPWSQSYAHYFTGLVHYEKNELDEAVTQLKAIVENPYRYPIHNVTHSAFLLSLCYQAMGLVDRAREIADAIEKHTFECGNRMFIALSEAFQADLDLRQGYIAQAEHWVESFVPPAPHALQRFYNAELTSVRIMIALNTPESRAAAADQLEVLHQLVVQIHHKRLKIDVLGLKALLAESEGKTDEAIGLLREAVALGQPGQIIRPLADLGTGLIKLLNRLDLSEEGLLYVGKIISVLNDSDGNSSPQSASGMSTEALSGRELEILSLFAGNQSNREIAEMLFISPGTVKRHAHNIYGKLAVNNRHDAVSKSKGLGILKAN